MRDGEINYYSFLVKILSQNEQEIDTFFELQLVRGVTWPVKISSLRMAEDTPLSQSH